MRPIWFADPRLQAGLLLAAVAVAWSGVLSGPFQFDDWNVIVHQPAVHSLEAWWASMPGIRPLLKLSYALDWQQGAAPHVFHLGNLLLHAANVLLVWHLLQRWPGLQDERTTVAWWGALIFALHPVQAEVAAYIAGRSVGLMSFFFLVAALCWIKANESPANGFLKLAATFFFGAALAVRETAVCLPLLLWVWMRASGQTWRRAGGALWPMWAALALGVLALLYLPTYGKLLGFSLSLRTPLDNLMAQVDALAYLFSRPLLFLEVNIDPDPVRWPLGSALWWSAAGAILVCLWIGFRKLDRAPLWGLALLWPFLLLWPTYSLVARADLVADRHLYLALLGPTVMLVSGVLRIATRIGPTAGGHAQLALLGLVILLGAHAVQRAAEFSSESRLWMATAKVSPHKARVWNNLGYAHLEEGRPDAAVPAFAEALRLDPAHPRARRNLQRALDEFGAAATPEAAPGKAPP